MTRHAVNMTSTAFLTWKVNKEKNTRTRREIELTFSLCER